MNVTLTLLFTDIEGSTRSWERHRAAMAVALERHDVLLREAIRSCGGRVFKTVGDAFCVVFDRPADALSAALAGQRLLRAEDWSAFGTDFPTLRVRMALHSGQPQERDQDFFGPDVNRVARLMACGHGGQILVSETTAEMVRAELPADIQLRDMGVRRLKDLRRPERVFQVLAPDLPEDFPALATLDARPNNLPVQLTSLVGREQDVTDLARQLRADDGPRLMTLTGPGGTGKTRLALQVAAELLDDFDHGVWFVDLAPLTDPELVVTSISQALSVEERPDRDPLSTLLDWVAGRQLLLVLDNFERLLASAPRVAELLAGAPGVKALVTSREALRLRGERIVRVQPLPVPALGSVEPLETLLQFDAVVLFLQRAGDADPTFAVTGDSAPAIAEVCARLDGLPLAIELAAARVRSMAVPEILSRLDQSLRLLTKGARDLPERHRTIRAAIAWSCELLEPEEQALFRRLAVFAGGCSLAAAEAICDPDGALGLDVADGLASLVEKSLAQRTDSAGDTSRYRMLETVLEFAGEALEASGDADALRGRHAAWFAQWVEEVRDLASRISDADPWIERAERDVDNLRAAMDWGLDHPGHEGDAYLIVGAFHWLLVPRGYAGESGYWGKRALASIDASGSRSFAAAGIVEVYGGYDRFPEAAERFGELGHLGAVSGVHNRWGYTAFERGELDTAEVHLRQSLALLREIGGNPWGPLGSLGMVSLLKGDLPFAEQCFRECLEVGLGVIWPDIRALTLRNVGCLEWARGDHPASLASLREALRLAHEFRSPGTLAECLVVLASMLAMEGNAEGAARLFAASEAILHTLDPHSKPLDQAFDPIANGLCAQGLAAIEASVPPAERERLWTEGMALGLDEAVALALGGRGGRRGGEG